MIPTFSLEVTKFPDRSGIQTMLLMTWPWGSNCFTMLVPVSNP